MIQVIDVVHSLYNVLLHPWLSLAGVSEVSVRLPSAAAVGLATAGVMVLGRRLTSPTVALVAGVLFALLPRVTWMGSEGRSYATTAAVAVWATILFVSLVRRPTFGKCLGYAALMAFAGSLNIFLILLVGAHGLALLLDARLRFSRVFWAWLGAGLAGVLGAAPVLLTAVSQAGQIGPTRLSLAGYARSVLINQWFLGDTPSIYLSGGGSLGPGPGSELWKPASALLAGVSWLVVAVALRRGSAVERQNREQAPGCCPVLVSWLAVPTVILVGYALVATPIYNPRYLTFCAPALAILLALGLAELRAKASFSRGLPWAAVGLIILLTLPVYLSQRTSYAKSGADWNQVAAFVASRRGPDQAVYFAPRTPPRAGVVGITSRTASVLYPADFADLRDLTLVSTAAQDADLLGRSQLLSDSVDRLQGIESVFVVNRVDYPPSEISGDVAILERAGFRAGDSWQGPLNAVTQFVPS